MQISYLAEPSAFGAFLLIFSRIFAPLLLIIDINAGISVRVLSGFGVVFTFVGIRVLRALAPKDVPRWLSATIDFQVLALTAAVSVFMDTHPRRQRTAGIHDFQSSVGEATIFSEAGK